MEGVASVYESRRVFVMGSGRARQRDSFAFPALREKTGQDWTLEHYGASDFNDPEALSRFRQAIREADILIGWQSMSIETVERLRTLLGRYGRQGRDRQAEVSAGTTSRISSSAR